MEVSEQSHRLADTTYRVSMHGMRPSATHISLQSVCSASVLPLVLEYAEYWRTDGRYEERRDGCKGNVQSNEWSVKFEIAYV